MVWTKENVINFLNAKVKDISYFEYPIPIELLHKLKERFMQ